MVGILLLAAVVRLGGVDWDEGSHLHPDERYLTMVVSTVRFPWEQGPRGGEDAGSYGGYWDTTNSPLNPANYDQFANYVYGTLPLFAARAAGQWADRACGATPSLLPRLYRAIVLGDTTLCSRGYYTGYSGIHLAGRSLSALADLVTLTGLMLLAATVYRRRVALLAGVLYALAPLPIQHAHFFVVDSFATVSVVWTLLTCALAVTRHRRIWLVPAGVLTGFALASKASVWPLALVVAAAAAVEAIGDQRRSSRDGASGQRVGVAWRSAMTLGIAGITAALAFRLAQPYAFLGPGFWQMRPNGQWLATMRDVSELMRGMRDVPFGHQWANRTPIVFPLENMVFWGLGVPLGIPAVIGWAWITLRTIGRRNLRHLIPWLWGTGYFLYQSTQWVKSMRYLLPAYPVFVLFAAWALLEARRSALRTRSFRAKSSGRVLAWLSGGLRVLQRAAPFAVVAGSVIWCAAFTSIYRRPHTRIEASWWLYANVPTAVQLETSDGDLVNIPVQAAVTLSPQHSAVDSSFVAPDDLTVVAVRIPKVSGDGLEAERKLELRLGETHGVAAVSVPADDTKAISIRLESPAALSSGERTSIGLSLLNGPAVTARSAVVANEHWDDPLPLRMEGRDAFLNWYQGLTTSPSGQINNYDDDNAQKRRSLLTWLNEADYLVLSSNRLYASIPRLPTRYPLTTEYYRLLLGGQLGFDLVASFVSYPSLGSCQFPDQEMPFTLTQPEHTNARPCEVSLPPAEEAFSVYDHPTVLVFRKSDSYSASAIDALLPRSLLDDVYWVTPKEATSRSDGDAPSLLLSPRMREAQSSGGTWSRLFNSSAMHNENQRLTVFVWGLSLTLVGWLVFPLLYLLLPNLRCRGYGLSRAVGLLAWSYLAWVVASLRLVPYTRVTLWCLLALIGGLSAFTARRHWQGLRDLVSSEWRLMLAADVVFLVLFLAWTGVRWLNPDLWHPVVGGEKPMDFAYFNAVLKSTWFPPYDPWFSGGQLNYYYFGFVIVGTLTKALGIVPSVAYNLAIPSLFAMTGVGGLVLASNLAGGGRSRALRAGLWGTVAVVILGNLGEVRLLGKGLAQVGDVHFESLIPGYPEAVSVLVGIWRVLVNGASLQFRPEWWYWDATRIIPVNPGEVGPINEFPAFTYLYADLHAHAMALPFTQVALAVAVQWALGRRKRDEARGRHRPQPLDPVAAVRHVGSPPTCRQSGTRLSRRGGPAGNQYVGLSYVSGPHDSRIPHRAGPGLRAAPNGRPRNKPGSGPPAAASVGWAVAPEHGNTYRAASWGRASLSPLHRHVCSALRSVRAVGGQSDPARHLPDDVRSVPVPDCRDGRRSAG